jgi:hypothetical protein
VNISEAVEQLFLPVPESALRVPELAAHAPIYRLLDFLMLTETVFYELAIAAVGSFDALWQGDEVCALCFFEVFPCWNIAAVLVFTQFGFKFRDTLQHKKASY